MQCHAKLRLWDAVMQGFTAALASSSFLMISSCHKSQEGPRNDLRTLEKHAAAALS